MNNVLDVRYEGEFSYNIVFSNGFMDICEHINKLNISEKKLCIVTETNVGPLYAEELKKVLEPLCKMVIVHTFNAGEANKNLDSINGIYETLIKNKFDRKDMLVALGGGVTGDMTGFAAATYLRGIDFVQVPTTLLSQVDSSIGGKTGVDYKAYKNMVGAFHMPKLVYMNLSTLNSLTEREYLSGMGEIIKHGLIYNKEYYNWLKDNSDKIIARDYETIKEMISESCKIKRHYVEEDPKEKGIRANLNFGHTIGHSIEKDSQFALLHGECVALGMVSAAYASTVLGTITEDEYNDIVSMIKAFKLPITISGISKENVLEAIYNDKKMSAGKIKFIYLKEIGNSDIYADFSREDLSKFIEKTVF